MEGRPSIPNIILTLLKITWRRKRQFQVDGIGRERLEITNKILALLKVPPPSPNHTGI